MATIGQKVKEWLGVRDRMVSQLHELERAHVAAGAARARELVEADRERAKIMELLERPARLRAEFAVLSGRETEARIAIEQKLRKEKCPPLDKFTTLVERLSGKLRAAPAGPDVDTEPVNALLTDEVRITNVDAIERWAALAPLLIRMQRELRDTLWRLDGDALEARVAALREEIEDAVVGTTLEKEMA